MISFKYILLVVALICPQFRTSGSQPIATGAQPEARTHYYNWIHTNVDYGWGLGGSEENCWWFGSSTSGIAGCSNSEQQATSRFQGFRDTERQNTNYVLRMRPEGDEENVNGAKTLMVLLAGEERNEEESGQGQPGSGATAAAELSEQGGPADGAAVLTDNRNPEDHGGSGSGQENEKQPEEPVPNYMGDLENVKPVPEQWSCVNPVRVSVPECQPCQQHRFTVLQRQ